MTEQNKMPGADAELDEILTVAYACTRVWVAWQYGTMSEDDFTPAAETEIRDDLIAWRDAAVAAALEAARQPVAPAEPSLRERVTSVLTAAGFREWEYLKTPATQPAFTVADGVGATVSLSWAAPDNMRALWLAKFAERLRADGLKVDDRGRYLYVHEPKTSADAATTAAEG